MNVVHEILIRTVLNLIAYRAGCAFLPGDLESAGGRSEGGDLVYGGLDNELLVQEAAVAAFALDGDVSHAYCLVVCVGNGIVNVFGQLLSGIKGCNECGNKDHMRKGRNHF